MGAHRRDNGLWVQDNIPKWMRGMVMGSGPLRSVTLRCQSIDVLSFLWCIGIHYNTTRSLGCYG